MNKINFCNKIVYENQNISKKIIQKLNKLNIFEKNKKILITEIPEGDYLVSLKVGRKFLLFITTIFNKKFSFLIDVKNKNVLMCRFRFNDELYTDTLFSGEITKNIKNQWTFYISDLILLEKKNQRNENISTKIEKIYDILKNRYIYDEFLNIINLEIIPFFFKDYIEKINLDTKIYFLSDNTIEIKKMKITSKKIFQKNIENNIKEFLIKKGNFPDVYYINENEILFVKDIQQSHYLKKLFENNKTGIKMKCIYNNEFNKWSLY